MKTQQVTTIMISNISHNMLTHFNHYQKTQFHLENLHCRLENPEGGIHPICKRMLLAASFLKKYMYVLLHIVFLVSELNFTAI